MNMYERMCRYYGVNHNDTQIKNIQSKWELLEEGRVIGTYDSHTKAKNALHWKLKEASDDWEYIDYKIRKI